MDSAELLDLLGNANRRRILRLLAHKPCYVTEISEYLGVSPKAVIDHLGKLEDAGLVENRTDDRQRKYYSIARNLRLEVQVSPHEFGTKSAYPASAGLDVSTWRHVTIEVNRSDSDDGTQQDEPDSERLKRLAHQLEELEQLENELSLAQRWVQGRLGEVWDNIDDAIDDAIDDGTDDGRLYAALIGALANGVSEVSAISRKVDAPPEFVEDGLELLAEEGIAERRENGWQLCE